MTPRAVEQKVDSTHFEPSYDRSGRWLEALTRRERWPVAPGQENSPDSLTFWLQQISDGELRHAGAGFTYINASGQPISVAEGQPQSELLRTKATPALVAGLVDVDLSLHTIDYVRDGAPGSQLRKFEDIIIKSASEAGVDTREQTRRAAIVVQDALDNLRLISESHVTHGTLKELEHTRSNVSEAVMRKLRITDAESLAAYIERHCAQDELGAGIITRIARKAGITGTHTRHETSKSLEFAATAIADTILINANVVQVLDSEHSVRAERIGVSREARINKMRVPLPAELGETTRNAVAGLIAEPALELIEGLNQGEVREGWGNRVRTGMLIGWNKLRGLDSEYVTVDRSAPDLDTTALRAVGSFIGVAGLMVAAPHVTESLKSDVTLYTDSIGILEQSLERIGFEATAFFDAAPNNPNVMARVSVDSGNMTMSMGEILSQFPENVRTALEALADSFDGSESWARSAEQELLRLGGELSADPAKSLELLLSMGPILSLTGDRRLRRVGLMGLILYGAYSSYACTTQPGVEVPIPTSAATEMVQPTEQILPTPTAEPTATLPAPEVPSLPVMPPGLPEDIQNSWGPDWTLSIENGIQIIYNPDGQATLQSPDGVNWERVVKIEKFTYVNRAGETIEMESSSDQMTIVKLLADNAEWNPAGTDDVAVFARMDTDIFHQFVKDKFDIGWPPPDRRTWGGQFPRRYTSEEPSAFMAIFCTPLAEGTLVIAQTSTQGEYYTVYYAGDISEFQTATYFDEDSPVFQYIEQLAAEH